MRSQLEFLDMAMMMLLVGFGCVCVVFICENK